jgi:apolipoprotein N-acyltransferase
MSSFQRGSNVQPNLQAQGYQIAAVICYEIAFPELVRANMTAQTDFLLTVSNDAWFGRSIGPHQHMEIAQMRAIELGRPLIRVTNNGITAIVDTKGNITARLPQFEQGVLRSKVPLVSGQTYFYRWGQWPIIILCLVMLGIITSRKLLKAQQSKEQAAPQ